MRHYDVADFLQYYTGAFILNPRTNDVVQVAGHGNPPGHIGLSDNTSVPLSDLDWKHVRTPLLGYRSSPDGAQLHFIQRRPHRLTQKGVCPAAIVISVPGIITTLRAAIGGDNERNVRLSKGFADRIFKPSFVHLDDAINTLEKSKVALGFALAHNWAVTLGTHKDSKFLLHFMDIRIASGNGSKWKWVDKECESLFKGEFGNV